MRHEHLHLAIFLALLFVAPAHGAAQGINWISFDALPGSLRREARPLLIFIHADWCKYCKLQDHNTFGDERVIRLINEQYYALRLDAETAEDIAFLNRTYRGRTRGYHELAGLLGREGGQLVFPTTVILSPRLQLQHRWRGFMTADSLLNRRED